MDKIQSIILHLDWGLLIFACLTIGLAPFAPPHLFEKLQMLAKGDLKKWIDWFDLFMHGTPWILLLIKGVLHFKKM
ncbi:MAG: hypothetical protein KDD61_11050 [Bdellovibrionales bacterium]|nr:hypothetical protein [Bdellovibrionales bacterium]